MEEHYENNLQKLHKKSISASEIASQYWCEKQMELNALYGGKRTYAMQKGSSVHKEMQMEVYEEIAAEPQSFADRLYKEAYDNCLNLTRLKREGNCREFKIYGSLSGYTVVGKIDGLKIVDGKIMVIEDKTIRDPEVEEVKMRPHRIQVILYRKLLGDILKRLYTYQNFANVYKIESMQLTESFKDALATQGVSEEMISMRYVWNNVFNLLCGFDGVSDSMEINYIDRSTRRNVMTIGVQYSDDSASKEIAHIMKYWSGEREALPVVEAEKWKCKMCQFFGNHCTVWVNRL